MRTLKLLSSAFFLTVLISCQQNTTIATDKEPVTGTSANAKRVLSMAEAKLKEINSFTAKLAMDMKSDMYGDEHYFGGTVKAEYDQKNEQITNIWYDSKQNAKGNENHFKGVVTPEGIKELHIFKKKVVVGGKKARTKAWISSAASSYYGGSKRFFKNLRNEDVPKDRKPLNVWVEKIEDINGTPCYAIKVKDPMDTRNDTNRYYFSVKEDIYYGKSVEINYSEGYQITKTFYTDVQINTPLPKFDVEVPKDFAVERYTSFRDIKDLAVGDTAPDWALPDSKGNIQTLSKYKEKLVLMDFWATWCGPCKAKMPHIQEVHEKFKDKGLKVVSVLSSDKGHEKQAVAYLKKHNYTFDMVYGNDKLSDDYKIKSLPTVIVVDSNNKIVYFKRNPTGTEAEEKKELETILSNHLNK